MLATIGRPVATADVGAERVRSGFHPEIQGLRRCRCPSRRVVPPLAERAVRWIRRCGRLLRHLRLSDHRASVPGGGSYRNGEPAPLLGTADQTLASGVLARSCDQRAGDGAVPAGHWSGPRLHDRSAPARSTSRTGHSRLTPWTTWRRMTFRLLRNTIGRSRSKSSSTPSGPILIVGLVAWAGRLASRRAAANRAVLIVGLGAVGVISFGVVSRRHRGQSIDGVLRHPHTRLGVRRRRAGDAGRRFEKAFGPASQRRWMARAGRDRHGRRAVRRSEPLSRMDRSSAGGRDCRRDRGWDDQVAICAGAMAVDSAHDLCRRHLLFGLSLALAADHRRPLCHRR